MELDRLTRTAIEIDLRIPELMLDIQQHFDEDDHEMLLSYMRAAYGSGYTHALQELERGELMHVLGCRVPERGER